MSDNPTRVEVLASELETLRSEINELDAIDTPTDEQKERFGAALGEWDIKKAEHDTATERAAKVEGVRSAAFAQPANRETSAPNVIVRKDPFEDLDSLRFDPSAQRGPSMASDVVERATAALEQNRMGASEEQLRSAIETVSTVPGAAQHALIHGSPAYRAAFTKWLRTQGQPYFEPSEAEAWQRAMSLSGANGGYTLPTLLDPTLIKTGTVTKNPIREIARVESGTQNVWHGVTAGNVSAYWTPEAQAMTEGSPTLTNPSVTAAKLTAYLVGSYEVFEDTNLQAQLPMAIEDAFSYKEQDAFITGSGSDAPMGIITAISGTAGSTVTASTRGTFAYGDLVALHDAIPSRYEDSATFVGNKGVFTLIRGFASGSNGSLFWANLGSDTPPQLIDSPYVKASSVGAATTSGSIFLVYGDFSQYLIYDRLGTQVELMQNVTNASGLPTGQRGLIAHKRVGGNVLDVNAFRFLKG